MKLKVIFPVDWILLCKR